MYKKKEWEVCILAIKRNDVEKIEGFFLFSVFTSKIKITSLFGQSQSDLFTLYHSNGNCKEKENSKVIYEYSLTHFLGQPKSPLCSEEKQRREG